MADKLKLKSFPRNFTVLRLVQETDLPRKLILVLESIYHRSKRISISKRRKNWDSKSNLLTDRRKIPYFWFFPNTIIKEELTPIQPNRIFCQKFKRFVSKRFLLSSLNTFPFRLHAPFFFFLFFLFLERGGRLLARYFTNAQPILINFHAAFESGSLFKPLNILERKIV